ncbi:MAG TPA: ATP-binding cassette domain-containing protein, partial [Cytophagaceae bacterium]|nr:ATP-binding cassette domain-containing protein [Cytophagaceae bacterium]
MKIVAEKIGKKYNKEWIFRNLSLVLQHNQSIAITGANGAGKSTFLQLLAGTTPASEGKITYKNDKLNFPAEEYYKYISYAAPYLELIEEMTIRELANFHKNFKPFSENISTEEFLQKIVLEHAADKEIRQLSSGMKQRVKLGLALFSRTPIVMLDEPTTNLDNKGIDWYLNEINQQLNKRIIIISSNQK